MADIAFVFGWTPATMLDMTVTELIEWHGLAIKRLRFKWPI